MSAQVADLKASSRAAALQAMQKAAVGDQAQGQQQHRLSMAGGSLTHLGAVSVYGGYPRIGVMEGCHDSAAAKGLIHGEIGKDAMMND